MTDAFPMIEKAVRELVEERLPDTFGDVGGSLSYERGSDPYCWIGLVPGGRATAIGGTWNVDIDVFADSYSLAMRNALALEAAFLDRPYGRTSLMRIDTISQNESPAERYWDDDTVFRVGATYVFTARRSG